MGRWVLRRILLDQAGLIGYATYMKTMQLAEAKANFSSVLREVQAGDEIGIVYGKKKETVAVIIPYEKWKKSQKRRLGTLEGKMPVVFAEDFTMTDGELITQKLNEVYENIDQDELSKNLDAGLESLRNITKDDTW